jgi:small conductance mechanosensitive channel
MQFIENVEVDMAIDNPLAEEFDQAQLVYSKLTQFFVDYTMQVIGAIIILIIGFILARSVSRWFIKFLVNKDLDITLSQLLGSISYFAILFCFAVIALGKFGISVTPFVAALGAFTLGAGLAVQGIVSNYAAGFSIILSRPFVVGNTLSVQGVGGIVDEIRLSHTVLATEDGEKITIPNREIVGQILENSFQFTLVETVITLPLDADAVHAIDVLKKAISTLEPVTQEPPTQVGIDDFSSNGIKIGVRCWVPTVRYFDSKYRVNGEIYRVLTEQKIALGVPRHEIQVLSDKRL